MFLARLTGMAALLAVAAARADEPPPPGAAGGLDRSHRALLEKVRPSIVGVRARGTVGELSGTGIVLDREGHILTASSVVGRGAENIRVWLPGPRSVPARLVGVRPDEECALIRVEAEGLVPLALGDSDAVEVGRRVYTVGNAENAIINDDQACLSAGLVSGLYAVRDERMGSTYTGRVLETTAAVNPGMEGGALVDSDGRLIGMVILNYSPLRWLGVAVPVNTLTPAVKDLRREAAAGDAPETAGDAGAAWLGAELEADGPPEKGLRVRAVAPGSPAEAAGLAPEDRVLEFGGRKLTVPADLDAALAEHAPGDLVWIRIRMAGELRELRVKLGAMPEK